MFDFDNYKKQISNLNGITSKRVLINTDKVHRLTGVVVFGHCLAHAVIECTNYGNCAGMQVSFILAKNDFDFLDKEFQQLRYKLSDALNAYNATNNGVFRIGGGFWIENENQSYWGLGFNDLNKIDPTYNRLSNDAINCVNSAIGWLFNQKIYDGINGLYNYFYDKKLLLKF